MKGILFAFMFLLVSAESAFADNRSYWRRPQQVRCDDNRYQGDWRYNNNWHGYRPDYRDWRGASYSNYYNSRRNDPGAYDDRYGYNPGDCPRGFHVNERNCTHDERRRGCMDLRSPSGRICVGWR